MARQDGRPPTSARPDAHHARLHHARRRRRCSSRSAARKVICTASVEDRVPPFLRGHRQRLGDGRIRHAARAPRPRGRSARPSAGKVGGRTQEIQRLIGRSLRSVDDDDGAGRTHGLDRLRRHPGRRRHAHRCHHGRIRRAGARARAAARAAASLPRVPVTDYVAATSVGIVGGTPMLDLAYEEDSRADVDMNVVKTSDGRFIELQGTAETQPVRARPNSTTCSRLADSGHRDADRAPARGDREDSQGSSMLGTCSARAGRLQLIDMSRVPRTPPDAVEERVVVGVVRAIGIDSRAVAARHGSASAVAGGACTPPRAAGPATARTRIARGSSVVAIVSRTSCR